jgi:hypothetical protein
MSGVASDEDSTVFQCGRGDDQVGITAWMSVLVGEGPEVGGAIENRVGDWQYDRVLAESREAGKLRRGVLVLCSRG